MNFFDEAAVKAKEVFDMAGKKTEEIIAVQKLRYRVASLTAKLNDEYRLLGTLHYDAVKKGIPADALMTEQIEKISALEDELKELREEIARRKGREVCPACKREQPESAVFCAFCGVRLAEEDAAVQNAAEPEPDHSGEEA